MIDYNFKSSVMESDIPLLQKKYSQLYFYWQQLKDNGEPFVVINGAQMGLKQIERELDFYISELKDRLGDFWSFSKEYKESVKINYASYKRVKRLKDIIESMLQNQCVFLTFTFNDKYINNKKATLQKYVQRYLKALNCRYVANIDYGKKNGRLHFHALVEIAKVDFSKWSYGDLDGKSTYNKNNSAIAKYISKLTNHAIKDTCKGCRIMYSRLTT